MLLLRRYSAVYARNPYRTSFVTCFVKGSAADALAQTIVEKNGARR